MHTAAQWFIFDDAAWSHRVPWEHSPWLLLLAWIVASVGAYTAFGMRERIAATGGAAGIAMAGLALGFGIWSIHFVGMLAVNIDLPLHFDVALTALSVAWAIGASALAMAIVGQPRPAAGRIAGAAVVLGLGMVSMQYTGLAALRMQAAVAYSPWFLAVSLLGAIGLSGGALAVLAILPARRIVCAAVMGLAVVLTHAIGMLGTGFFPGPTHEHGGFAVAPPAMAVVIMGVNALVAGLALLTTTLDRRAGQAREMLRDAIDSVAAGLAIYDSANRLVMCNQRYRAYHPSTAGLLTPGRPLAQILAARRDGGDYQIAPSLWDALSRDTGEALEVRLRDGTWAQCTIRRMRGGGTAELWTDITSLKRTQADLAASEGRLDRAQQIARIGSWDLDVATGRYDYSRQMFRLRGLDPDTFVPTLQSLQPYIHPEDLPRMASFLDQLRRTGAADPIEVRNIRPDGSVFVGRMVAQGVWDSQGRLVTGAGTTQDVTEQRITERALAEAQKMEALGKLTGGMAHDFNNMLGVVLGNLDMLKRQVPPAGLAAELCDEALEGAERCAELIRRLLAFSRRQPLRPDRTDVSALVNNIARLLGRTLGEQVTINLSLAEDIWPVLVDAPQLEAALVNIATNARDAMPRGGTLTIRTRNTVLDAIYGSLHADVTPGEYVLIEISDTGVGIESDVIEHIFEPFFTTKGPGKGTGLGLSMAFGFVKQSGGHLSVYSEPGLGATFLLYLPRLLVDGPAPPEPARVAALRGGVEVVLVVEDSVQLRRAAVRQLGALGYAVLEADAADAALAILSEPRSIDLLFTDVVMPGAMDGLDLALRAQQMRPGLRVVLTSGFPGVRSADERLATVPFPLLSKPYSVAELAAALRSELDKVPCAAAPDMAQNTETPSGASP